MRATGCRRRDAVEYLLCVEGNYSLSLIFVPKGPEKYSDFREATGDQRTLPVAKSDPVEAVAVTEWGEREKS